MLEGTPYEVLQVISFILAVLTFYFTYKRAKINKLWLMDVPMFTLMIHAIIFYGLLFISRIFDIFSNETPVFTPWSAMLRLHSYAVLFILAYFYYLKEKNKWI